MFSCQKKKSFFLKAFRQFKLILLKKLSAIMKYILTLEEYENIIKYLKGGNSLLSTMNYNSKQNYIRRMRKFILMPNKLYLEEDNICREVTANDDLIRLDEMLNKLHLPSHLGMTAMYKKSELKYAGFRREKIYEIVSNCITCKKHVPPARIAPITPIISTF
ncbi:hypothetical protein H311_00820, partial [Anncaliia algerae PRA109]